MDFSAEFCRCLTDLDVPGIRRVWKHVAPNMPQPNTDEDALISLHIARTASSIVPFDKRAYSHAWIVERGLPSSLPDHLRPRAQRLYPVFGLGVGISVKSLSTHGKPAAVIIQGAMEDAVKEAAEDRKLGDSPHVKRRIDEARRRTIMKLFG